MITDNICISWTAQDEQTTVRLLLFIFKAPYLILLRIGLGLAGGFVIIGGTLATSTPACPEFALGRTGILSTSACLR